MDLDSNQLQQLRAAGNALEDLGNLPDTRPASQSQSDVNYFLLQEIQHLRKQIAQSSHPAPWQLAATDNSPKSRVIRQLLRIGISQTLIEQVTASMDFDDRENSNGLIADSLATLIHHVPVVEQNLLEAGGVFSLIGPAGAGKTTMIARLAAQFIQGRKSNDVVLISTDDRRVGAHEQLLALGERLHVPIIPARSAREIDHLLHALGSRPLVLIDTGSLNQQDLRKPGAMLTMQPKHTEIQHLLVLPATTQPATLNRIVQAFTPQKLLAAVITKVDEAQNLGNALSVAIERELPVAWWSDAPDPNIRAKKATALQLITKAVMMVREKESRPPQSAGTLNRHELYPDLNQPQ